MVGFESKWKKNANWRLAASVTHSRVSQRRLERAVIDLVVLDIISVSAKVFMEDISVDLTTPRLKQFKAIWKILQKFCFAFMAVLFCYHWGGEFLIIKWVGLVKIDTIGLQLGLVKLPVLSVKGIFALSRIGLKLQRRMIEDGGKFIFSLLLKMEQLESVQKLMVWVGTINHKCRE